MTTSYRVRIDVRSPSGRAWAGFLNGTRWTPAVAGTANQTGLSDAEASTFDDHNSAQAAIEALKNELRDEDDFEFRIVNLEP